MAENHTSDIPVGAGGVTPGGGASPGRAGGSYDPPTVTSLGRLADLTQGSVNSSGSDGTFGGSLVP